MLKTPTAQLAVNGGSQHPDKRKLGGHGPTLADEVEWLLSSPTARLGASGSVTHAAATARAARRPNGPNLDDAIALLPTPRASDGPNGGPAQRGSSGDLAMPSVGMQMQGSQWGVYGPAIRRWENETGSPAPAPTAPLSRTGEPRLSPQFVEWLMGLPSGWVTDVPGLTRAQQLSLLGDGVVPQQARHAYRQLIVDLATTTRAGAA